MAAEDGVATVAAGATVTNHGSDRDLRQRREGTSVIAPPSCLSRDSAVRCHRTQLFPDARLAGGSVRRDLQLEPDLINDTL